MRGRYFDCEMNTITPMRAAIPSAIIIQGVPSMVHPFLKDHKIRKLPREAHAAQPVGDRREKLLDEAVR